MKYGKAEGKISIQWYLKQSYWLNWAQNSYPNPCVKNSKKILCGRASSFFDALLGILQPEESSVYYEEKVISIYYHQHYEEFLRQLLIYLFSKGAISGKFDVAKISYYKLVHCKHYDFQFKFTCRFIFLLYRKKLLIFCAEMQRQQRKSMKTNIILY